MAKGAFESHRRRQLSLRPLRSIGYRTGRPAERLLLAFSVSASRRFAW